MIKGLFYSKSLKRSLTGFLISCFMVLGSFVSAFVDLPYSFNNGSVSNTVSVALNFSNSVGGRRLNIPNGQYNSSVQYYVFWNNGKLYYYQDGNTQGYFSTFSRSEGEFKDNVSLNTNNADIFYNLTQTNFTKVDLSFNGYGYNYLPFLCFYESISNFTYCTNTSGLTGSIGIPNGTSNFTSYATTSNFNSSQSSSISDDITVQFPTAGQLTQYYENNGFSSGLCYSSSKIFSGGQFVSVEPQSILTLFSSNNDYVDSVYKFGQYCESSVYNSSACSQAFAGEDLRFNIISKTPKDFGTIGGRKELYQYCYLLTVNPNTSTAVLSGYGNVGTVFNSNDVSHAIINGQFTVVSPNSGTVYSDLTGDSNYSIFESWQRVFSRITGLFSSQSGGGGFLPSYILVFLGVIILFKLFRK